MYILYARGQGGIRAASDDALYVNLHSLQISTDHVSTLETRRASHETANIDY